MYYSMKNEYFKLYVSLYKMEDTNKQIHPHPLEKCDFSMSTSVYLCKVCKNGKIMKGWSCKLCGFQVCESCYNKEEIMCECGCGPMQLEKCECRMCRGKQVKSHYYECAVENGEKERVWRYEGCKLSAFESLHFEEIDPRQDLIEKTGLCDESLLRITFGTYNPKFIPVNKKEHDPGRIRVW